MTITIPRTLQKRVRERAKHFEISEEEFVRSAVAHAITNDEALDDAVVKKWVAPPKRDSLREELRAWRSKARKSSLRFWKKHNL